MGALSSRDAAQLARILGMCGSEFDGERATAASLATRRLQALGLNWQALVDLAVRGSEAKPPPAMPQRGLSPQGQIRWLQCNLEWCTDWESEFARSVARQGRPLTARQVQKLAEVFARVMARRGETWAG